MNTNVENASPKLSFNHHLFRLNYEHSKGSQSVTADLSLLTPQMIPTFQQNTHQSNILKKANPIHFNQQQQQLVLEGAEFLLLELQGTMTMN